MFKFFDTIITLLSSVVKFAVSFFVGFIDFFNSLITGVVYLSSTIAFLPPQIVATATVIVSISIVFLIIGRNS